MRRDRGVAASKVSAVNALRRIFSALASVDGSRPAPSSRFASYRRARASDRELLDMHLVRGASAYHHSDRRAAYDILGCRVPAEIAVVLLPCQLQRASLLPSRSQTQSSNVLEKLGKIFRRIVTPCQVKRFEAAWNDNDQAGSVKLRTDPAQEKGNDP